MKKTSLSKGTIYLTLSSLTFVVSGYLINIYLGRYLGPSLYGIYGIVLSLMTAVNLTQTAGLPQAIAKFTAEDENSSDNVLKSGLVLQIISTICASVLFFLMAKPIALILKDSSLTSYLQLVAFVFPLYGVYSIYLNYYNGLHNFKSQALMNIVYSIVKLLAVVLLVLLFHVYGAIWGFIISPFIAMLFWIRIPKTNHHFSYKKLIQFSLPLIAFAILSNLLQSIDLFFIKSLVHIDKNTGFYTANQNIAEMPFYGVIALASVLFPSISRNVSQNLHQETKDLIIKSIRFALLIIVPSVLLISATSLQILSFLYSSAYHDGAASLSLLVIGSGGFFTFFVLLATIISSSGAPHKSALLAGVGLIICSVSCLLFIPKFGLIGAALSTTIASFSMMIAASIIVYRKFHVLFIPRSVAKIFFVSLLIYFFAKLVIIPTFLLPLLYIASFFLYGLLLFLIKEINHDDIRLLKSLIPSWFRRKTKI